MNIDSFRMLLAVKIGVSLSFLGLYFFVIYISFNPDVSEYYYSYYIERITDVPPHEQRNLERGDPVVVIDYDGGDYASFSGWSVARNHQRWSLGDDAVIHFRLPDNQELMGFLVIKARYLAPQSVSVFINSKKVDGYEVRRSEMQVELIFNPDDILPDADNEIKFVFSDARRPEGPDQRRLAMALLEIRLY